MVAPRKFDVLKTNISSRSEASRASMLVLRTSNFKGQINSIVYCSPRNFLPCASSNSKITLNYFCLFYMKAVKAEVKFEKESKQEPS